jgi:hypothetical protein
MDSPVSLLIKYHSVYSKCCIDLNSRQDMLRIEFWKLLRNESSLPAILQSNEVHDHATIYHKVHCFDYLRQTLMCNMDMTVEFAAQDKETGMPTRYINGWDIPHTC